MRIPRVIRAFSRAAGLFAKRQPAFTIILLFVLVVFAAIIIAPTRPPETPAPIQAQVLAQEQQARVMHQQAQQQALQQAAQRQIADERTKELCTIKAVCEKYGEVRQQCATAGNYQNCLQIKMGTEDYDKVEACTEDGKPLYVTSANMPDAISCFLTR